MPKDDISKKFEQLVKENELLLWKVCNIYAYNPSDRKDLFQDIVMQLWKAFPNFRGESKISTWIYRVAINTSISALRKKNDFIHSYDPKSLPVDVADAVERGMEEQLQQLYGAIARLNEIEKAIVMLYLEDRSYEEMVEILGISNGALRVKMNRIKNKLRGLTQTS